MTVLLKSALAVATVGALGAAAFTFMATPASAPARPDGASAAGFAAAGPQALAPQTTVRTPAEDLAKARQLEQSGERVQAARLYKLIAETASTEDVSPAQAGEAAYRYSQLVTDDQVGKGLGVTDPMKESLTSLWMAAEFYSYPEAQYLLASQVIADDPAIQDKLVVPVSKRKAVKFLEEASKAGNEHAAVLLADYTGKGN